MCTWCFILVCSHSPSILSIHVVYITWDNMDILLWVFDIISFFRIVDSIKYWTTLLLIIIPSDHKSMWGTYLLFRASLSLSLATLFLVQIALFAFPTCACSSIPLSLQRLNSDSELSDSTLSPATALSRANFRSKNPIVLRLNKTWRAANVHIFVVCVHIHVHTLWHIYWLTEVAQSCILICCLVFISSSILFYFIIMFMYMLICDWLYIIDEKCRLPCIIYVTACAYGGIYARADVAKWLSPKVFL